MSHPPPGALLPHGPPMVLLDEVLDWDEKSARCGLVIRPDAPLVRDGRVRGAAVIEYMAQCVGVFTALRSRERGEPPKKGYLVGAKTVDLSVAWLRVGDELLVEVVEDFDGGELGRFLCAVSRGGEVVARASLSVYCTRAEPARTDP